MNTEPKDDGSGTRSQWMRLAEEAIQDAAYWKGLCRDLTGRVETLERQVANMRMDLNV